VNTLIGRNVQPVAGLDVERAVSGVDVPNDAIHPELARTVNISQDVIAQCLLTIQRSKGLRSA
jgi:hypothetical protein